MEINKVRQQQQQQQLWGTVDGGFWGGGLAAGEGGVRCVCVWGGGYMEINKVGQQQHRQGGSWVFWS